MNVGDTIETVISKEEVLYFSNFFDSIDIIEGLFSADSIQHPLLKNGLETYKQRLYHRRRGDKVNEELCKISMQYMHSSTNQKKYSTISFGSIDEIREFLSKNFLLDLELASDGEIIDFLTKNKYFDIVYQKKSYKLSYININSNSVVYSLSAQVISNARVKMLKTIDRFLSFTSVELCYANVDSIHISIEKSAVEKFLIENSDIISDELGAMKVEAIANRGYWFDVGRYWLKMNDKVVLYKNKGFNQKNSHNIYASRRKIIKLINEYEFTHTDTYTMKIEKSFSYQKRVEHQSIFESIFTRFEYDEVKDNKISNYTEGAERLQSMHEKIELFKKISF